MTKREVLTHMVSALNEANLRRHGVLHWGAPVASFGDPMASTVATLGLNPSNREFVDVRGRELDGRYRRFPTLRSLGIGTWADAGTEHLSVINHACANYFHGNPYDAWFRRLDKLLQPAGASFYGKSATACHLDLVPYATEHKWGELTTTQRRSLLEIGARTLALSLRHSTVKTLIMNGASVVRSLETVTDIALASRKMPPWALPRRAKPVDGIGYWGRTNTIAGIPIGREIFLLGYNHNIQSSFGVTTEVMNSIGEWIGRRMGERSDEQV